jgi:hypothetical protein
MSQQTAERQMIYDQDLCLVAARRIRSIKLGRLAVNESNVNALELAADLQVAAQMFGDELDIVSFSSNDLALEEAGQDLAVAIVPAGTSGEELRQLRCARLVNEIGPTSPGVSEEVGFSLVASLEKIWGDA